MKTNPSPERASITRRILALGFLCGAVAVGLLPSLAQNTQPTSCSAPGTLIIADPAGDQTGAPATNQQFDILSVSAAEPCLAGGADNLVFTIKVANLISIPVNGRWKVQFVPPTLPAKVTAFFVEMTSDENGTVSYDYGNISTTTNTVGAADGTYNADGTITVTVANSKVGNPAVGQTITKVQGRTQILVGAAGTGLFQPVDSTTQVSTSTAPTYTLVGHASCTCPAATPTPTPAPVAGGAGVPRFFTYNPPPTNSFSGGEPSIGSNWQTGNAMYVASLTSIRITFDDCSSPAVDTWVDTKIPAATSLDAILFTDHMRAAGDTTPDRTFVSQLTGQDSITFFTDNDGQNYLPSQGGGIPSGVDHQTIGAGPYRAGTTLPHTYPNAVYYCSQDLVTAFCARSDNGGASFGPGLPIYETQCVGIHGHVKVAPDGTVYVPNRSCGGQAAVIVSKDNGVTWAIKTAPGSSTTGFLVDPSVGIGTNDFGKAAGQASNTIYLGYQAADGHARIAVSRNQGDTWTNDQDVSAGSGVVNTTFPEVVAGDDNRAAYAFFGTTVPGNYTEPAAFPANAPWHLYIASTFDGGVTWTTVDATPTDPVQRGTICNLGTTSCKAHADAGIPDRNLLDFMDATVDAQGRTMVGYPDGCIGTCIGASTVTDPKLVSRTALASVARQSGGKRLFVASDPVEPSAPAAPRVNGATSDGTGLVRVTWSAPDNGGSPITGYNVYRRLSTETFATTPLATVPAGTTRYDDPVSDPNASYFYKVTALNQFGESVNCNEFAITTPPPVDPCVSPGFLVDSDPTGDQTGAPANNDLDIQGVYVGEPYQTDGVPKLVFTMKIASLATILPNRQWRIVWTPPTPPADTTTDRYYVGMNSNAGGPDGVTFEYGAVTATGNVPMAKGIPEAGLFTAEGVIQIAIANSKVGNPGAGSQLTKLSGRNFAGTGNATLSSASAADSTVDGTYALVGNNACRLNAAPVPVLVATPSSGTAPLSVGFDASGSSDPDTTAPADTIVSYTFNFGDGTAPVTQSTPTASHTYNSNGSYQASLQVTDSRGKQSSNAATALVEVSSTLTSVVSRKVHGTAGTFDLPLPFDGSATAVESRSQRSNGEHTLVFSFARPLTGVDSVSVTRGTGTVSGSGINSTDPTQYIVNLSGVANAQTITVSLAGVHDSAGANVKVAASMGLLLGDVNGSRRVDGNDVSAVQAKTRQTASSTTFKMDVNATGLIDGNDVSLTQSKTRTSLP